ncbi:mitogen-activated protein kinase kinase kinase kinase 4-like [Bacillus rossius redtenbacheri]|uniref:mitogen-activated protein kinase kinase kinase kinase 4-like n=1 Tax=Bacillus rossius redtenbacheri TaxID=93214 RepID=UPI002FDE50C4
MTCRVAVKILENVSDNVEEIEEEYLVLRDLSLHPNLPAFHGLFLRRGASREEDQLWFVMELCTGGSVTDLVQGLKKRGARLSEDHIAYILRETVEALIYLHANHCIHRDVKGHNILLTEGADVKLVDFGVSSHLCATLGRRNTSVGTPYWMAPEVRAPLVPLRAAPRRHCPRRRRTRISWNIFTIAAAAHTQFRKPTTHVVSVPYHVRATSVFSQKLKLKKSKG